jgi:hypothetical protein
MIASHLERHPQLTLNALAKGLKVIMGEVTGHLTAMPLKRVAMLITSDEAILRSEIEVIDGGPTMGELVTARFNEQYFLLKDIRATVISPI